MAAAHQVATDDAVRWLRSLPENSVDHGNTDPPYCSGGFNEKGRRSGSSTSESLPWLAGDALGTLAAMHLMREVAVAYRRIIKPAGTLTVFTDWKMIPAFATAIESAGWRWRSMLVWDKLHPASGQGWRPQHEIILHFCDPTTKYSEHPGNVLRYKRVPARAREHPTQKPVDLLVALLRPVVSAGDVVADCFAGSGTLIEACERLGAVALTCDGDPAHRPAMERRAVGKGVQGTLLEGPS